MSEFVPSTIDALLARAISVDPTRPLLTYYDDATGERAELSATTLDNWVAKTANLVVHGHGLGRGDLAAVLLPPHWQTAAVLLGCWSAGLTVGSSVSPTMGADIAFASTDGIARDGVPDVPDVYGLSLAPLAAPIREAPPGVSDYVVEVRAHGDQFTPVGIGPADMATPTQTHEELCRHAVGRAGGLGLGAIDRVLVDAGASIDPVEWLLAPLAGQASIVLCRNLDRAKLTDRAAAERVTVDLTGR